MPHYSYFLETADQPITPAQPAWHCLLPTGRRSFQDAPAGHQAPSITLGHYFQAVRAFLEGPAQAVFAGFLRGRGLAMFRDQFDFDSMDTLNFAIALHREFGVDVPETDYAHLASLDQCVAYLAERLP